VAVKNQGRRWYCLLISSASEDQSPHCPNNHSLEIHLAAWYRTPEWIEMSLCRQRYNAVATVYCERSQIEKCCVTVFFFVYSLLACDLRRSWRELCTVRFPAAVRV